MRIVTGHDYYDSALAYGRDEHVVFVRQKELTIPVKETPLAWSGYREGLRSLHPSVDITHSNWRQAGFTTKVKKYELEAVVVYFCGKRYNGIIVKSDSKFFDGSLREQNTYWTYDSFVNFLDSKYVELTGYYDSSNTVKSFFDTKISKNEFDFMIENKYTILISQNDLNDFKGDDKQLYLVNAPALKNVQFYKIVDAYTAFQEISMWVGGVLTGQGRPMVKISDKYKVLKHGFDKWSFRKLPQGK